MEPHLAITVTVTSSIAFMSPLAGHAVNVMVMGAGGHKRLCFRVGIPLTILLVVILLCYHSSCRLQKYADQNNKKTPAKDKNNSGGIPLPEEDAV